MTRLAVPVLVYLLAACGAPPPIEQEPRAAKADDESAAGARPLPSFAQLWEGYPDVDVPAAKELIFGDRDAYSWIKNTCAVRLSRALNDAVDEDGELSHRIPPHATLTVPGRGTRLNTVRSAEDGLSYAYRVEELIRYLEQTYGAPTVKLSGLRYDSWWNRNYYVPIEPAQVAGLRGIIFTRYNRIDSFGHVDIWDGVAQRCRFEDYFDEATEVWVWDAPRLSQAPQPAPRRVVDMEAR